MRVLYWTERFWPHVGGVEVLSAQLIPALQATGHDFCLVTSHSAADLPDEDNWQGVPLHRLPFLPALTDNDLHALVAARRRLAAIKRAFRPDLVHIHFSGPSPWFHWQTADAWPSPTLVTLHALPAGWQTGAPLLAQTLARADHINSVARFMRDDLLRWQPALADKLDVIYNGIADQSPTVTPLPIDPPRLLCVGRLVDWKGFDTPIRALALLADRFPTLRLTIAGDGPQRAALAALAAELGVAGRVDFCGWVGRDALPALYAGATLVLVPSHAQENLPLVAQEALLHGRPLLASAVGGLPELLENAGGAADSAGALLPVGDAPAWAAALAAHLGDAPRLRRAAATAARAGAAFTLAACAAAYDRRYGALAAAPYAALLEAA